MQCGSCDTVKPVLCSHSKEDQKFVLKMNYCLMQVKIIAECGLLLNAGQNYCRMLTLEHSAILLTCIMLQYVLKTFVLSIFEWPHKTGFPCTPEKDI